MTCPHPQCQAVREAAEALLEALANWKPGKSTVKFVDRAETNLHLALAQEPAPSMLAERTEDGRRGYLQGYAAGVEAAARTISHHCDCTHADVPEIVRLLACDPRFDPVPSPVSISTTRVHSPAQGGESRAEEDRTAEGARTCAVCAGLGYVPTMFGRAHNPERGAYRCACPAGEEWAKRRHVRGLADSLTDTCPPAHSTKEKP